MVVSYSQLCLVAGAQGMEQAKSLTKWEKGVEFKVYVIWREKEERRCRG